MRPVHCEFCSKRRKLEMHHPDYSKPLAVRWVCRPCHDLIERVLRLLNEPPHPLTDSN